MTMWTEYRVTMRFTENLMGGVPKNPDLIADWLNARKATEPEFEKRKVQADMVGEVLETIDELVEEATETIGSAEEMRAWTGFQQDDLGLFVRADHVKAHLKDCANVLRGYLDLKALRSKVADRVYPFPKRIRLVRDGAVLADPDGYWEHPVHVGTPQGKRSALKRTDYVEGVTIVVEPLKVLADKMITLPLLQQMLEYGGIHGFGAERGLGYGQYEAEIEQLS